MADPTPMQQFVLFMRAALERAGLRRVEHGGAVYFVGGSESAQRTLVLVHGVNDQAGTWAAVVPSLVNDFRLIVPDLAGHGDSAPHEGPLALPFIVEQLRGIIEREARGEVALVGNSMGAWVSLLIALAGSPKIDRLVLEAGGGLALPLASPLTATTVDDAKKILRAVHGAAADALPSWAVDAVIARSTDSPLLRLLQSSLSDHFVDARLQEITVPTLVLWGEEDGVVPRAYVERVRDSIPGATMHVIANAAHIPHAQQPERFVECLRGI